MSRMKTFGWLATKMHSGVLFLVLSTFLMPVSCIDSQNADSTFRESSRALQNAFLVEVLNEDGSAPLGDTELSETLGEVHVEADSSELGFSEYQEMRLKLDGDTVRTTRLNGSKPFEAVLTDDMGRVRQRVASEFNSTTGEYEAQVGWRVEKGGHWPVDSAVNNCVVNDSHYVRVIPGSGGSAEPSEMNVTLEHRTEQLEE